MIISSQADWSFHRRSYNYYSYFNGPATSSLALSLRSSGEDWATHPTGLLKILGFSDIKCSSNQTWEGRIRLECLGVRGTPDCHPAKPFNRVSMVTERWITSGFHLFSTHCTKFSNTDKLDVLHISVRKLRKTNVFQVWGFSQARNAPSRMHISFIHTNVLFVIFSSTAVWVRN